MCIRLKTDLTHVDTTGTSRVAKPCNRYCLVTVRNILFTVECSASLLLEWKAYHIGS